MGEQTHKSVKALISQTNKDKKLQGPVYMGVSLKEIAAKETNRLPSLVPLPNKTRRTEDVVICLVVKDPVKALAKEVDGSEITMGLFDDIIGVGKLRRRLKSKKAIDEFASTFTYIFVQDKVSKPLNELLGVHYFKTARHFPIVVSLGDPLDLRALRYQVKRAMRCSQILLRPTTFLSVLVGHSKMDPKKLEENIEAASSFCKKNFTSAKLQIKTPESMSLEVD